MAGNRLALRLVAAVGDSPERFLPVGRPEIYADPGLLLPQAPQVDDQAGGLALLAMGSAVAADVVRSEANNGNLVMEDVPPIPQSVVEDLNRYQNVRSAGFVAWDEAGEGVFVRTRFGDVPQLHHVAQPGGARTQLTFFDEPIGGVLRQPGGSRMVFTMDAGGSEFSQIFMLDPTGLEDAVMLTDGESRNGAVLWDRDGRRLAYQSTARNGASKWPGRWRLPRTPKVC